MPSTVHSLLEAAEQRWAGAVPWGQRVPHSGPGVYLVSRSEGPLATAHDDGMPVISRAAVAELLDVRPELRLDGARPDIDALAERLQAFWLPTEAVVYIGLAGTSIRTRVQQYYATPLGAAKPHAGGWFLKTLEALESLWVHYAATPSSEQVESQLLRAFVEAVEASERARLHDPSLALPFGNLEWPRGNRKGHGITGARGAVEPSQGKAWVATNVSTRGEGASAVSRPARALPREGSYVTQRVTAVDVTAGQVRLPAASKVLLPTDKATVQVNLGGTTVSARWDPRRGPDRERSGVLRVGGSVLGEVVIGQRLSIHVDDRGMLHLTL